MAFMGHDGKWPVILWDSGRNIPDECGDDDLVRVCRAAHMLAYGKRNEPEAIRKRLIDGAVGPAEDGDETDPRDRTAALLLAQWELCGKGARRLTDASSPAWVAIDGVPNVSVTDERNVAAAVRPLADRGCPVVRVWLMDGPLPRRMLLVNAYDAHTDRENVFHPTPKPQSEAASTEDGGEQRPSGRMGRHGSMETGKQEPCEKKGTTRMAESNIEYTIRRIADQAYLWDDDLDGRHVSWEDDEDNASWLDTYDLAIRLALMDGVADDRNGMPVLKEGYEVVSRQWRWPDGNAYD